MIDLASDTFLHDPYPSYTRLRDEAPVFRWELPHHDDGGMWVVSRYDDVRAVLADRRLTKVASEAGAASDVPPIMLFLDPPEHTRIRVPTVAAFTRHRVAALRPAVEAAVRRATAPLVEGERIDLVPRLARPVPLDTIGELLGVPSEDRAYLHDLTQRILDGSDAAAATTAAQTTGTSAGQQLEAYFAALVASRVATPGGDLLSAMLHLDGAALTEADVTLLGGHLLVNGHETTVNLIGTALHHLLTHRHQWEALVADPGLIGSAVEECLRFDAPTQRSSERFALEPIELHGVTIERGQQVSAFLAAANRDPRRFERPDELDVTRSPNPHLSFGHGLHRCLGAALTRLELTVVLEHLTAAAPDLDLVDATPTFRRNSFDRGLVTLPVVRR